jgi:uncharacterized ferritin-like protein (DUF455 family)
MQPTPPKLIYPKSQSTDFFNLAWQAIKESNPEQKCILIANLFKQLAVLEFSNNACLHACRLPGYPPTLKLVAPRELQRRGLQSQQGRNVLIHAIAHIEYNAMNLALDAAYRFRNMPRQFYLDWISVAADEARHFQLLNRYLNENDCGYGDFPAHNGLWEMAEKTADNVVARMALVPRVMEARGLDVTPKMIERLENIGDMEAAGILKIIYQDEIGHVNIGSSWFHFTCEQQALNPRTHFFELVEKYLHGELRGPFNLPARLQAGFDEFELAALTQRYDS